jgi:hypothetical protein
MRDDPSPTRLVPEADVLVLNGPVDRLPGDSPVSRVIRRKLR